MHARIGRQAIATKSYGALLSAPRLPEPHPPVIVRRGQTAHVPVTVVPFQFDGPPAERYLWERVERPDERERVVGIRLRISHPRHVRVWGIGRPCVRRQLWTGP